MKRVREIYHRRHGFLRNLTGKEIQVGGIVGGFILEPCDRVESADRIPEPIWELLLEKPTELFTAERSGLYSQTPSRYGARPGDYWANGQFMYAPIIWVVPDGLEFPSERRDVMYAWQI